MAESKGLDLNVSMNMNATSGSQGWYNEDKAYTICVSSFATSDGRGPESLKYEIMTEVTKEKFAAIMRFLTIITDKAMGPIKRITIFPGGYDKNVDKFGTPVIDLHNNFEKIDCDFVKGEVLRRPENTEEMPTYHFFLTGLAEKQGCSSCRSCCPKGNNMFLHLNLTEEEWNGANRVLSLINSQGIASLEGITSITPLNDKDYHTVCDILHKNP